MESAINELKNNPTKSVLSVARQYNVPEATLCCHVKNPDLSLHRGPAPFLTKKEELAVVEHVNQFTSLGLKISSFQLQAKAEEILKAKKSEKKKLGKKWFRNFRKRNPAIVYKKPEKVDPKRMDVSIPAIQTYFDQLKELKEKYNIPSNHIFNADETGVPISPDLTKTIGIKGKSRPLRAPETHEQLTLLVAISSHGELLTSLFIWKEKSVQLEKEEDLPTGVLISASTNGFITGEIFAQWISKFVQETKTSSENPAILILDPHQSRANIDALQLAQQSGLHIIVLPGGLTHLLQPLDKSLFRVFKQKHKDTIHEFKPDEEKKDK